MTCYAHSKENAPKSEWQTLDAHIESVAQLASSFASHFGGEKWAHAAAILHDIGKARTPFQDMLAGKRARDSDTQHAKYGAAAAFAAESLPLAFIIAGHHAGLHDLTDLATMVKEVDAPRIPSNVKIPSENDLPVSASEANPLPLEYFTRMLFSCLIDADRLDAAFWAKLGADTVTLSTPEVPLNADALMDKILAERDRKRSVNLASPMADIRNHVFDACVFSGEQKKGFFSLTVPTGGGKTLAGMAFALSHAKHHPCLRRIIVVIPYLSIIEQNAAEYRRVLDPENKGVVLECHSSVKPCDNASEEENSRLELISENWDAPIVVTTSVQFIESLFAASPSRTRKLHNIANSVVIFDEVQALPTHLLAPILSVFRELVRNYGVSMVFSSATQPAFRKSSTLPDGFTQDEIREIAPEPESVYKALRRVDYYFEPEALDWDMVAKKLCAAPQCLCVVNLTRHARVLWEKLNKELNELDDNHKPLHLSSAMCPAHRLAVIRHIRRTLAAGKPCRVISTQLIEAGVDLDFPVVWRAMGPLDSIVQVAGRCNREGSPVRGKVHIFRPVDNKLPGGIYNTATGQTAVMLASLGNNAAERLANDPSLFTDYFTRLFQLSDADKKEIQSDRERFRFRTVAYKTKVIEDSGTPVVIPIGRAKRVIAEIRNRSECAPDQPRFTRNDLRRLQRYMVNVRQHDLLFYHQRGMLTPLLPNLDVFVFDTAQYNCYFGVFKPDDAPPSEDFLL